MKNTLLLLVLLLPWAAFAQNRMPHLENGQLIADGKPFVMLAGELHNSSTGSLHKMEGLWEKMAMMNLNTVIAPVSWELCEPEEGSFDFSLLDAIVWGARENNLKVVLIWFESWKNGTSTYVLSWVKLDQCGPKKSQPIFGPALLSVILDCQIFSPNARSPGSPMPGIMYDWLVSSSSMAAVQRVTSSPNFLLSSSTA